MWCLGSLTTEPHAMPADQVWEGTGQMPFYETINNGTNRKPGKVHRTCLLFHDFQGAVDNTGGINARVLPQDLLRSLFDERIAVAEQPDGDIEM